MFRQTLSLLTLILIAFTATSQNNINGKLVTSDGQPAAQVNIELKGLKKNTISNNEGYFEIKNIPDGKYNILVSFVGLQTQEKTIEVSNAITTTINFILLENAKELAEVIISAKKGLNAQAVMVGKIAINPMDLPQSIALVGQSTIRDQQSQRLSDVIKNVNGVYLSNTRGATEERFSARGYAFSSTNMFKNGSRVNSGTMPEISSLEKVEILKGSAAILYGNVAPGGIINMVTKQPRFNSGGEISTRAGSFGLLKPGFDVYGPLTHKLAYRINGAYEKTNSYRDVVKSNRYYINPSLLFKITDRTELLLQADYLKHDFTPDFGIGSLNDTIIPDLTRSAFLGTPWQYNKVNQMSASATLKEKLSKTWNLNINLSYQDYKRDYYSTEKILSVEDGKFIRPLGRINTDEKYVIGQVDITGKFKAFSFDHTLLAGIDADKYYTTAYTFSFPAFYDSINIFDPSKYSPRTDIPVATKITKAETPVNRIGAYIQDLISLSEKIKLMAGIRWSQQEARPVTTTYLAKDSVVNGTAKKDRAFSPRVGLVYKPFSTMSLFASYSNSFSVNSGTDVYRNALAPSIIDQYEIGVKKDLLKGKLSANLTLYKIINNNLAQTAQFDAAGAMNNNVNLKELVGQTTSNGIELDISSQPVKGLNILAGYSYNDMRYTNITQAKGNYIEGERLVNTPAHTANASVFYTFQKCIKGLKIGAAAFYTGNRFGGWNNTQGYVNPRQPSQTTRLIPVKGFTTVDLSAGYTFKRISVLAKVSNLFNTFNYYVHENYSINPIAPAQFIGTLSVKL